MKIGDYVRTKKGIGKIMKCNNIYFVLDIDEDTIAHEQDEVIKSSPNIIDLIEVGDYVNGREVREVTTFGYLKGGEPIYRFKNDYNRFYDKNYKIKSILTKEQFESMKYKVGE